MTTRSLITIAASAVFLSGISRPAAAQNGFTGVITFATHSENGRNGTLIETASGNKVRIESVDSARGPGARGAIIIDAGARTFTILMNQQRYMVVTEDQMKARMAGASAMSQQMNQSQPTTGQISVVNTGRTETVAGVSCQVYHVTGGATSESHDSDVCVAQGVGFLSGVSGMLGGMGSMSGGANAQAMTELGDALKGGRGVFKVTEIKGGQPTVMLVATKIDRTPPPASAFVPPPGATQIQMPAMPAGMGGMPGGTPSGMPAGAKPPG